MIRHINKLEIDLSSLGDLVYLNIDTLNELYPELEANKKMIKSIIIEEKDKFVTNQSRVTYARDKTNQIYYEQKQIFKDIIRSLHLHSLNLLRTKKRTETITSTLLEYTKRYVVWTR